MKKHHDLPVPDLARVIRRTSSVVLVALVDVNGNGMCVGAAVKLFFAVFTVRGEPVGGEVFDEAACVPEERRC